MSGRPKGSRNIPWGSIVARLRKQPGTWMILPEMRATPYRTIATIRRRERRALRLEDGVIRCRRRAIALTPEGDVIVTLALQFEPKGTPK
jgi:hypothetical protein